MCEKNPETRPGRRGCWWATLVGLIVIAGLAVPIVRWGLWMRGERASVEHLAEEARRFGGDAGIPEGGVNFSERKIDVFLDLARSNLGDEEFARLAGMPAFRHLHTIDLSDTRITDKSLQLLEHNPTLIGVNLSRTKISDEGLESIAKLPWLSTLELTGTNVTDRGMDALVKRSGSWDLRGLGLTDTKVTAEGVRKLSKVFDFLVIEHPAAVHPMSNKQ